MKHKLLTLFLLLINYQPLVEAKTWEITEEMMQELTTVFLNTKSSLIDAPSNSESIKVYRSGKKGFNVEVVYKQGKCPFMCVGDLLRHQALIKFKPRAGWNAPNITGMVQLFQNGFFINYIYKLPNGKMLSEFKVNREALFGKKTSKLLKQTKDSKYLHIVLNKQNLSFFSKDLQLLENFSPGAPYSEKYCDIEFNQERYHFENKIRSLTLSVSVITLSKSWPINQQLQCINKGDFEIQEKVSDIIHKKYLIETSFQKNSNLLKPVYEIVENTERGEELVYAFSSLVGDGYAIYFVFSGSNKSITKKMVTEIVASVKLEDMLVKN